MQTTVNESEVKTEIFNKFSIQTSERWGKPVVYVYNLKAKKIYNALQYCYHFTSIVQRDEWVAEFKNRIIKLEEEKKNRKIEKQLERKNFINTIKAGDILSDSWGYEQTNVEFYKVISVKGSVIEIRELKQKTVPGSTYSHAMADMRIPSEEFVSDAPVIKKIVRSEYIKINESISLSKWNGRPMYCSWYA